MRRKSLLIACTVPAGLGKAALAAASEEGQETLRFRRRKDA
jgi:hypothetical protein